MLKVLKAGVNETVVEVLEQLLEEARKGECIEVCGVAMYGGSEHRVFASSSRNTLQMAGALLKAANVRCE